jgi:predicted nucleic acid-binding protein
VEIAQVLRRYALNAELTAERGAEALADLRDFPITRYDHEPFLSRIWELRHNLSAYDAAYLSIAEAFDAPLLTCDARIAHAHGHRAHVELVV